MKVVSLDEIKRRKKKAEIIAQYIKYYGKAK